MRVTEAFAFSGGLSAMQNGIILALGVDFLESVVALLLGAKYRQRRGGKPSYACNAKDLAFGIDRH